MNCTNCNDHWLQRKLHHLFNEESSGSFLDLLTRSDARIRPENLISNLVELFHNVKQIFAVSLRVFYGALIIETFLRLLLLLFFLLRFFPVAIPPVVFFSPVSSAGCLPQSLVFIHLSALACCLDIRFFWPYPSKNSSTSL